jgi:hypothetical protein
MYRISLIDHFSHILDLMIFFINLGLQYAISHIDYLIFRVS